MKRLKNFNTLVQGVVMIALFSFSLQIAGEQLGVVIPAKVTASVLTIAALFIPMPKDALCAGVYREVWTGQMLKYLTSADAAPFLLGLPDYSQYVSAIGNEAMAIHLAAMNVLPDVLINNTTYGIPLQSMPDADVLVALDKYQTKRTPITDDELFAISYKRMEGIIDRHGISMRVNKFKKGIHSLAPSGNTAKMPVLVTTGADDGTGRKKLTWDDIVTLKRAFDNLEYPEDDRRLVLCSDHLNDLIVSDQRFQNQYYNRADGKPYNQLGFEFFDYVGNPYYNPTTKAKIAFSAVPAGTDRKASVAFCKNRTATATGWTKMYYKIAEQNPEFQQNEINFRHYYIALPTEEAARGAIVSANVA